MTILKHQVIEGRAPGPHLLITGGVHGDEYEPMAAIRRLMSTIQSNQLCGRLTLVPVVNEAAFIRGTRTAEDGLDLARTCPGRLEGSTTEQIAHAVSQLIRTAGYYIDLHTGGIALSLLPFVGYMLHSDPAVLDKQRRMAHAFNLPIVWGTTPTLHGRTLSVARDANIPAIYAEYLGGSGCNQQAVDDYADGCLNVMRELKMIQRDVRPSKIKYVIEDNRRDSGHLQIQHPAPATGFFEPAVELGQIVQQGDLLGRIIADPLAENTCDIRAQHGGVVLCLATLPRVLQGSGVAVILEIEQQQ